MEQKNVEIDPTASQHPEVKSFDLADPNFYLPMTESYAKQFPQNVKIRAEIAYAKAHIVTSDDEEIANKQVDEWVKSQLPRIFQEVLDERTFEDYD